MMKKRTLTLFTAFAVGLIALAAQAVVPVYTGFTVRQQGYVIQASDWNNEFQNLISFINTNVINNLNLVTAGKAYLLTCDGANLTAVTNAGSGDDGKVLTLDSTQTPGMKWSTLVSGIAQLTTLGDTVVLGPSGLTRLPVGTNGNVLTADSTQPNGVAYEPSVPSGGIMLWYGTAATVPTGWYICNGQTTASGKVTPNMQGVFAMGAGNQSPAATGGFGLISSNTSGGRAPITVSVSSGGGFTGGAAGANYSAVYSGSLPLTGTASAPAYLALYYIMKN